MRPIRQDENRATALVHRDATALVRQDIPTNARWGRYESNDKIHTHTFEQALQP